MSSHSLSQLSDGTLRIKLAELSATDRVTTAHLLAHLAEFDARRLYAQDGYPSTFKYCVQHLSFSEDMAFKRIRAARAARRFPFLLKAIADGRVHLTAVVLLGQHLTPDNARELLVAATHKTKAEIEQLLAERFPQPDVAPLVRALPIRFQPAQVIATAGSVAQPHPQVAEVVPEPPRIEVEAVSPSQSDSFALPVESESLVRVPSHRLKPLSPGRYALQVTIGQDTHDKLSRIQDLLGHALPSGELAQVLDRALDALLEKLEKAKCGAADRPRSTVPKPSINPCYVPKRVRREVWKRDGGQCTFVSASGRRCTSRRFLEYDHVLEVARGGSASVDGVRLLCRTHNQYAAERTFGPEFMRARREAGRARRRNRPGDRKFRSGNLTVTSR